MRKLLLFLALAMAASPAMAQPVFVGDWFGMDQPDIKSLTWIVHWKADGSFRVHFRHCKRGKDQDMHQAGSWTLQAKTLTMRMASVNGEPFAVTDVYEILSGDRDKLTYRERPSRFVYHASRVAPDYRMPGCEMTS